MPSWKKFQKQHKINLWWQRLKIGLIALALLFVTVRLLLLVDWLRQSPPAEPSANFLGQSDWRGDRQLNLFINPNWMVGIDLSEKEIQYFQFESVESDENDLPLFLTTKNLHIYLDGYLFFSQPLMDLTELSGQLFWGLWQDSTRTNLSRWQILRIIWLMQRDYTVHARAEKALAENQILDESFKIAIWNGTSVAGLAQESAEWVENLGIKVIDVANASEPVAQTQVIVFTTIPRDSSTIRRLEQIFETVAEYVELENPLREDVRIVVGKDFLE